MIENSTVAPPDHTRFNFCFLDGIPRIQSTSYQAIGLTTSVVVALSSLVAVVDNKVSF